MHLAEATSTAVIGVALSGVAPVIGPILAQAGAVPDLGSWGQVASTIVSTGFAVWYAWHVTTKTLPEKDRLHQEAVKSIVDEFHRDAAEARDTFKQALTDIRTSFRCQHGGLQ